MHADSVDGMPDLRFILSDLKVHHLQLQFSNGRDGTIELGSKSQQHKIVLDGSCTLVPPFGDEIVELRIENVGKKPAALSIRAYDTDRDSFELFEICDLSPGNYFSMAKTSSWGLIVLAGAALIILSGCAKRKKNEPEPEPEPEPAPEPPRDPLKDVFEANLKLVKEDQLTDKEMRKLFSAALEYWSFAELNTADGIWLMNFIQGSITDAKDPDLKRIAELCLRKLYNNGVFFHF